MSTQLDVLLIESHPGAGDVASAALVDAGHRIHRCHDGGDSDGAWACVGLADPAKCPLDGHIDATVLARGPGVEGPTPSEDGVRCAIRSGSPVVGVGMGDDTVYEPWITLRTDEGALDAACHAAVALSLVPLESEVLERISSIVSAAGLDPDDIRCSALSHGSTLTVAITLPSPGDRRLEQAVAVRAYDALRHRAPGHTIVDVSVQVSPDPHELIVELTGSR